MAIDNRLIETSRGPVQVADTRDGLPVLYFHGLGVGNDLFMQLEQPLARSGFRLVVPNRPGYLNTPIACGKTVEDCIDLLAELLEALKIEAAAIMGSSAGGFFAAAFAARHPEHAKCLVLQCSNTHSWDDPKWLPENRRWTLPLLRRPLLRTWLLRAYRLQMQFINERAYLQQLSGRRFSDVERNQEALELCRNSLNSMRTCFRQPAGFENDFDILMGEQSFLPHTISCPTLVIHDPCDPVATIDHARWAVDCIGRAELCEIRAAGHLIWIGREAEEMHRRRVDFLVEHAD